MDLGQLITDELEGRPEILGASLISRGGVVLFSSLSYSASELAKRIGGRMLSISRIGDYSIKKLGDSSLVIMKISESFALALEGRILEGVLISLANKLASKLREALDQRSSPPEVEENLPAVPSAPGELPPPGSIPELKHGPAEVVISEPVIRVLRAIDGSLDVAGIARATGLSLEETSNIISYLASSGIVELSEPRALRPSPPPEGVEVPPPAPMPRKARRARKRAEPLSPAEVRGLGKIFYELDDRFKSKEEALRALPSPDELLVFVVNRMHDGLSALDYIRMAIEEGLADDPRSVLAALESLRSMGVIRKRGDERVGERHVDKRLPPTSASMLLLGRV